MCKKYNSSAIMIEDILYSLGKNGKNEHEARCWVPNEEQLRRIIVSYHSDISLLVMQVY